MEEDQINEILLNHCGICHSDWPFGFHHCSGTPTPCNDKTCPKFSTSNGTAWNYCPHCGHKLT